MYDDVMIALISLLLTGCGNPAVNAALADTCDEVAIVNSIDEQDCENYCESEGLVMKKFRLKANKILCRCK